MPRRSNVIWLADTNYRIELENASVRAYAEDDALDMLLAADQLTYVMSSGAAFSGYVEGPILFRPTYKYDVGTDNYDTSEKMRIPAWTGTSHPAPLVSCRKCIIAHRSGIIPREQARPVHLFPCRTQRVGSPSWYVFSLLKGTIELTTHPSICCVPCNSSYHRSCEEGCSGPFTYGERCFCGTR